MSSAKPIIKHDRFLVNFDKLRDHELVPSVLKFLNLAHGQVGGTELIAFTKFVSKMPFDGAKAMQSSMFEDTDIWGDQESPTTDYIIKKYSDLAKVTGAAELDAQLFPVLASCLEGTWLALLETVSKPLFCQAFAVLYATANKNSVRQKQSAISLLRDIKFNGSAEQLALDFVDASTAMFHSGVSMNDIILHEFAQIVYQRNKIGGSAINEALLKHAALKANKPDTPELNVYDFIQEHTALISTNLEVQTRINLAEAYIADATDSRPPTCARCQRMHPNATAEISTTKCWAKTDVQGNNLPPHTRTAVPPPPRTQRQPLNMAKTLTKVEAMMSQLTKQKEERAARKRTTKATKKKEVHPSTECHMLQIVPKTPTALIKSTPHAATTQHAHKEVHCHISETRADPDPEEEPANITESAASLMSVLFAPTKNLIITANSTGRDINFFNYATLDSEIAEALAAMQSTAQHAETELREQIIDPLTEVIQNIHDMMHTTDTHVHTAYLENICDLLAEMAECEQAYLNEADIDEVAMITTTAEKQSTVVDSGAGLNLVHPNHPGISNVDTDTSVAVGGISGNSFSTQGSATLSEPVTNTQGKVVFTPPPGQQYTCLRKSG